MPSQTYKLYTNWQREDYFNNSISIAAISCVFINLSQCHVQSGRKHIEFYSIEKKQKWKPPRNILLMGLIFRYFLPSKHMQAFSSLARAFIRMRRTHGWKNTPKQVNADVFFLQNCDCLKFSDRSYHFHFAWGH